jgi:NADPH:quinone reductase
MAEPHNRVVQVRRFGGPDELEVVDAPLPTAGRGEVRVRVLASSVVYTDVVIRRHLYPQTMHLQPPFVLGYDVVGEIDQLGDGVSGLQLGDRVADMTVVGSNAAYRTLQADHLTRVPAGVDAAEAATLILSWTTAYQLLHRTARVQGGERVLVHGAAGAVGQALLTLGRMAGLKLWGTARGDHAALVRELGAMPIDYQREDFTRVLPSGFDVVFDGIGEGGCRRSLAALKSGGLLCAFGYTAGVQAQRRMFTILMWMARLYLWGWLPGGKRVRFYSINAMRARHPPGSGRTWSGSSSWWRLGPSGRASPSGSLSMKSPKRTAVSKRAASRASSSCARTSRRGANGRRLSASRPPISVQATPATRLGMQISDDEPCSQRQGFTAASRSVLED